MSPLKVDLSIDPYEGPDEATREQVLRIVVAMERQVEALRKLIPDEAHLGGRPKVRGDSFKPWHWDLREEIGQIRSAYEIVYGLPEEPPGPNACLGGGTIGGPD